jgi:hypothetical protein
LTAAPIYVRERTDARDAGRDASPKRNEPNEQKESQATILVKLVRESGAELFHDGDTAYVHVPAGDHHETHGLRSRRGRAWLGSLFFECMNRAPGSRGIGDATNTLEAMALRGPEHRVFVRIAALDDRIVLDLVDGSWRVVEVAANGWRVLADSPVRFRRPKGLLPLPAPEPGGVITDLRPFLNIATDDDFVLVVAVLLGWLRGRGPYPLLIENGEQGSAKSTLTRVLKALIDPNASPLRSGPREPRDLMIAATNGHLLGFDNLSDLPAWLSDALCRLSTGGGLGTRLLYSDEEEQLFDAVRPVVLNGIPEFASRPDLVSRSVFVTLPPIPDDRRRDESTFFTDFECARPKLLGALLDLISIALRNERTVHLDRLPRMADFAKWVVAAEPGCPWPPGTFLRVYSGNREQAIQATIDGDPVADFIKVIGPWSGTAKELLGLLNEKTPETVRNRKDWFKRPGDLANALRRLAPALRQVGFNVTWTRTSEARLIHVTRANDARSSASPPSPASPPVQNPVANDDDDGDAQRGTASRSPTTIGPGDIGDGSDAAIPGHSNAGLRERFEL